MHGSCWSLRIASLALALTGACYQRPDVEARRREPGSTPTIHLKISPNRAILHSEDHPDTKLAIDWSSFDNPSVDALYDALAKHGPGDKSEVQPIVVLEPSPDTTIEELIYHRDIVQRQGVEAMFLQISTGGRRIPLARRTHCGIGQGLDNFEIDLQLYFDRRHVVAQAVARESDHAPGTGAPEAAMDPHKSALIFSPTDDCIASLSDDRPKIQALVEAVCEQNGGVPYELGFKFPPQAQIADLYLGLTLDTRPDECQWPLALDTYLPSRLPNCDDARHLPEIPQLFATAKQQQPMHPSGIIQVPPGTLTTDWMDPALFGESPPPAPPSDSAQDQPSR